MPESVLPVDWKGSTTLNPSVTSFDLLKDRIYRACGAPAVSVEVCDEQIYDNINQAIEWYSKYAGYTTEYLIFSSSLYEKGLGIKLDKLFSITPELYSTTISTLSSDLTSTSLSALSGSFDYDLANYRKVIDVFSLEQGESSGINTLFTLEQAMAQQIYSSYLLGYVGFDLVTWHVLKDWLDIRSKVLGQIPHFRFDPRTQYLRIIPEPQPLSTFNTPYYGLIGCYVERPIRDLIKERWVYRYALALSKITIGHIRTKFSGTQLFGGGTINGETLLQQGIDERQKLEDEILTGYGEVEPPMFFVG